MERPNVRHLWIALLIGVYEAGDYGFLNADPSQSWYLGSFTAWVIACRLICYLPGVWRASHFLLTLSIGQLVHHIATTDCQKPAVWFVVFALLMLVYNLYEWIRGKRHFEDVPSTTAN